MEKRELKSVKRTALAATPISLFVLGEYIWTGCVSFTADTPIVCGRAALSPAVLLLVMLNIPIAYLIYSWARAVIRHR